MAVGCALAGDALPWWFYALLTLGMIGYVAHGLLSGLMIARRYRKHPDPTLELQAHLVRMTRMQFDLDAVRGAEL